ncbi:MAG: hypothetical protein ACI9PY_002482 [Ascidiaceihabitans sp.]|jgi:hypothetical protein
MELEPQWEYVADGVMGGLSQGSMQQAIVQGREASILKGDVSLDNNGGFIQIAFDLRLNGTGFDASDYDGIELTIFGNDERYDIRLRTDQLSKPWQSFRAEFTALPEWHTIKMPFDGFQSHKTDAVFDPTSLRRIGILAIGREFHAEVAVASVRLYRD